MSVCGVNSCGVDTVATCLRCGERRCAAHYVISVLRSGDGWLAVTPNGSAYLRLPASWTRSAVSAYVDGGAACTRCREQAAATAQAERTAETGSLVEQFILAPSPAAIPRIMLREPELTGDQLRRMLAAARPHLTANCEVLSLRLQPPASQRRQVPIRMTVTSRQPGIRLAQGPLLLESGQLIEVSTSRLGVDLDVREVSCVGRPGVVPAAEYHPACGSGDRWTPARIYFTAARIQDEVHGLGYPLPRNSSFTHLFRGIAETWQ
jgi:hypothetical protein